MIRPGLTSCLAGALLAAPALPLRAEQDSPVQLTYPPDLTADIRALPQLVANTPSMRRINARLAELDATALQAATACNTNPPSTGVSRDVNVTFLGPGLFSLLTLNESYCAGAAHGSHYAMPLTFDLKTGSAVHWPDHFPADLLDPKGPPMGPDFVIGGSSLTDLYLSQTTDFPPECRDALLSDNNGYFRVWPSAADHGLALMPTGLPHAMQACADPVVLPVSALETSGFSENLLGFLENAASLPANGNTVTP